MARAALSAALMAPVAFAAFESWSMTMLDDAAKDKGAVCLDGSPGAYYMEPGHGPSTRKWMIHLQGGGWCVNEQDCVGRSKGGLGSSAGYAQDKEGILGGFDGGAHGLFSNDSSVNPDFHDWNKVYFRYCDGGSMAGEVAEPVQVGPDTIYFRGGRILNAALDDLLAKGLSDATDFIVEGCSAGGLNVWLHLDHIRSRMPSSVRVVGVPQCGLFMDLPGVDGTPSTTPMYQHVFQMMGAKDSGTLSADCLSAYPGEEWHCFLAQYTLPFIRTPFLAVNSFYDAWQWGNVLRIPSSCSPSDLSTCTDAERASIHALRDTMLGNLSAAVPSGSGFFTYSCVTHCGQFLHDGRWAELSSQGVSLRDAFAKWYLHGSSTRFDAPTEEPNANPTCTGQLDRFVVV